MLHKTTKLFLETCLLFLYGLTRGGSSGASGVLTPSYDIASNCKTHVFKAEVGIKQNVSAVYIRRMRKAGSTTVFNAYKKSFESIYVQGNEQTRFNIFCLKHPAAAHILYITHLREPLSRTKSEFYYMGPGGKHSGYQPNTQEVWMKWLEESHVALYEEGGNHSGLIHGGTYIDNLYVRALTTNCGECSINNRTSHVYGCDLCGKRGRLPRLKTVTELEYRSTMQALELFDLVIIIELLNDEIYIELIRSLSKTKILSFGHARKDEKAHEAHTNIPASVVTFLETQNQYDISLYLNWKQRIECRLESFKEKFFH